MIATPGRLLDLMNQGFVSLRDVRFSILDEADHMLDMGFIHDIRKIVAKLPTERQSLFFSATMPPAIIDLSGKILGNPEKVTIKPSQATAEKVEQAVYFVSKSNKTKLLLHLLKTNPVESTLVFSRTKHGCDKIVRHLKKAEILAEAIHGNKSQAARQRALKNFKEGKTDVLVATDIAARGIDVAELAMVIQNDLPTVAETYVHRIGRTGRAKASGIAISFCNLEEKEYLRKIEKLINQQIPVISEHPFNDDGIEHSTEKPVKVKQQQGRSSSRRNSRFGGGNRNPGGGKNSNSSNRSKGNRKWSKPPKKG